MNQTPPTFADVKAILDRAIANWSQKSHRAPNLAKHQDDGAPFGWSTREELLASVAFGLRLIDPQQIGKQGGGKQTNLYLALTVGAGGNPRMPIRGPYLEPADTDTIAAWIDSGAA